MLGCHSLPFKVERKKPGRPAGESRARRPTACAVAFQRMRERATLLRQRGGATRRRESEAESNTCRLKRSVGVEAELLKSPVLGHGRRDRRAPQTWAQNFRCTPRHWGATVAPVDSAPGRDVFDLLASTGQLLRDVGAPGRHSRGGEKGGCLGPSALTRGPPREERTTGVESG
jgi:hypothetical protein